MIKYIKLISSFTKKEITAVDFQNKFLKLFKEDENRESSFYPIIEPLFWAVEDFCEYPQLRDKNDLDEFQLQDSAQKTLSDIRTFLVKRRQRIDTGIKNNLPYIGIQNHG